MQVFDGFCLSLIETSAAKCCKGSCSHVTKIKELLTLQNKMTKYPV